MPLGAPLTATATGSAYPLIRVSETVTGVVPPCCTLTGDGDTTNENEGTVELNVAMTLLLRVARGVNVHVSAAVLHTAPPQTDQPTNVLPPAEAAVSVTSLTNCLLHEVPQSMPAGLEVTVPAPVPAF